MTLDSWVKRLTEAAALECPVMRLIGRDHEDPLFVGVGQIEITRAGRMAFVLEGKPSDPARLLSSLQRAEQNRYDHNEQLRLTAVDREGVEWSAGWTLPRLRTHAGPEFIFSGEVTALCTMDHGPSVSPHSSVELVFRPGFFAPMERRSNPVTSTVQPNGALPVTAEHRMHILGSEVTFFERLSEQLIWVTATTSDAMPHPFLENWLSEPLRILHGQLVYPWLVARNLGSRGSMVWVRPSRSPSTESYFAGLFSVDLIRAHKVVWDYYERLLKIVATPVIFEAHTLTQYYEEIIQANMGSRWVLCLTLASSAEGIAKMLMSPEDRVRNFAAEDVESIKDTVKAWSGDEELRKLVLNSIGGAKEKSIRNFLMTLVKCDILTREQVDAWTEVRNSVMHGNLVTRWSTKEEDAKLVALAQLVHRLTREVIYK